MNTKPLSMRIAMGVLAFCAVVPYASATTQPVTFNRLIASATVGVPLAVGDTLFLDTLVTAEIGALSQEITFTVGPNVGSFVGEAAWEISTAAGLGPRLGGVNIDLFDAGNTLIASDTFLGTLGGFALSTFPQTAIGPGTYKLIATGTGVRDSSLDVSVTFSKAIPEPETYAMMLAGLGLLGLAARRRKVGKAAA